MKISRRWLDWNLQGTAQKNSERELTKLTESVLSVLSVRADRISETLPTVQDQPAPDPEEWLSPVRMLFVRWLDTACALHPRAFGGVAALQINFCEWLTAQGEAPCDREIFVGLLEELGLLVAEVAGVILVSGMVLREDFDVYR